MSGSELAGRHESRRLIALSAVAALVVAGAIFGITKGGNSGGVSKGGTLNFITNQTQFDHIDPARVYTGRDIAFFNSYVYRNLVSYKPA